jgi:hypothetical protein
MSGSMEVEMCSFNASIHVTELLMKTLENVSKNFASLCIRECAVRHGFNADEEIRLLGLENLSLIRKQMTKKCVISADEKKNESNKPKGDNNHNPKEKKKSVFPMPFVSDLCDKSLCNGISYNHGLFTQCSKKQIDGGIYCNQCLEQSTKNASGEPDCGTIDTRLASGLYEFKDPNGRSPISYLKVLEKLKLTIDMAIEEAGKLSIEIPNEHLVPIEKSKKTKGRPCNLLKKKDSIEEDNVADLFAKLSIEGDEESIDDSAEQKPAKPSKKSNLTEEEKEAKKTALEEERAIKKAEREAKIADEKALVQKKKDDEAQLKKAERETKIANEKAERETKIANEKAEREAKRVAEKEERDTKKALTDQKKEVKTKKPPTKEVSNVEEPTHPITAPPITAPPITAPITAPITGKVSVTRIQILGKPYLKSSTNILYDPATKEEVGIWDPETKSIKPLPEEEDEEEEEEYDDVEDVEY